MTGKEPDHSDGMLAGFSDSARDRLIHLRQQREEGGLSLEQTRADMVPAISEATIETLSTMYLVDDDSREAFRKENSWVAPPYYRAAVVAAEDLAVLLRGETFNPFFGALSDWTQKRYPVNPSSAYDAEIGAAVVLNAFRIEKGIGYLDTFGEEIKGEWEEGFSKTDILGVKFGSAFERGRSGLFLPEHQKPLRDFVNNLTLTSVNPEAHVDPMRLGAIGIYRSMEHVLLNRASKNHPTS